MSSTKLAQTYVWHGPSGKRFFVSTINRASSAMMVAPDYQYSETMAWEWPEKDKERGECVYQGSCAANSLLIHNWVVQNLVKNGESPRDGDEEDTTP